MELIIQNISVEQLGKILGSLKNDFDDIHIDAVDDTQLVETVRISLND